MTKEEIHVHVIRAKGDAKRTPIHNSAFDGRLSGYGIGLLVLMLTSDKLSRKWLEREKGFSHHEFNRAKEELIQAGFLTIKSKRNNRKPHVECIIRNAPKFCHDEMAFEKVAYEGRRF